MRRGKGREVKGEGRGDKVRGGRDLAHLKILAWHPMAKPLAGFKGVASRLEGERKVKGGERNGNREKTGRKKGLEQGRRLGKAGPGSL